MADLYENVCVSLLSDDGIANDGPAVGINVAVSTDGVNPRISIGKGAIVLPLLQDSEIASVGKKSVVVSTKDESRIFKFVSDTDATHFKKCVQNERKKCKSDSSVFFERTDEASAEQYFQFYSYLSQQQNMMQDYIRTSTYQRAMLDNFKDFEGKVVLDVGAGSGILSFFAAQAGAKHVYAIEASSMAEHCQSLVTHNKLVNKVTVITGKVEDVTVPESVDIIISEPMGYMLFNERMLESFLHAKKWLKPGGKMFPTQGDLHIAPFTDEALYMEQFSKANFWYQLSFHGVDLSVLREAAVQEYFKQPIVDTFDVRICMAWSHKYTVDFQTAAEKDLHTIEIPVSFTILQSGTVHGLAFWFDVAFIGSQSTVWLSTAPTQPLTHWYQVRCLLQNPIFVKQGQTLTGKVVLKSNSRQSYDVEIELSVPGTTGRSSNVLDLKNPFFRYTGLQPSPPPGTNHMSPSDAYWHQQDPTFTAETMSVAPINPGSIPSVTVMSNHQQTRTSVGAGISPVVFTQNQVTSNGYPVSNQFMIGDYAVPGSMVLPSQGLNLVNKSG